MEILVIAILILLLFGAKRLPIFARSLGQSVGEFKKARDERAAKKTQPKDSSATPP